MIFTVAASMSILVFMLVVYLITRDIDAALFGGLFYGILVNGIVIILVFMPLKSYFDQTPPPQPTDSMSSVSDVSSIQGHYFMNYIFAP
jgi:hypothetical protein